MFAPQLPELACGAPNTARAELLLAWRWPALKARGCRVCHSCWEEALPSCGMSELSLPHLGDKRCPFQRCD